MMNILSLYGIKICAELSFVLSQSTRPTDRWTDGRTAIDRLHSMQCGKKLSSLQTPFKYDMPKLADLKHHISQKMILFF